MKLLLTLLLLATLPALSKPNFILISMDDMGYGDLGCFGSQKNRTPAIDQMAREGIRFTDLYSTSGVCTPSRASLLTGCYPRRLNLHLDQNEKWVLFPNARKGLNPDETTVAEILKTQGYATTCIGKWHLGDQPEFLPTRHGFDSYFGIPYSNDMGRKHIPLPLLRNETVIEAPVKQPPLTQRYTAEALAFIEANKARPFFLYLPHTSVHLPLFPGKDFAGKSKNGKYGDWIEEVDHSTAQILEALKKHNLDKNTLVIFTSDNGSNNNNGGSNAPLSGSKGTTREGGMRVPCIMRWPGKIPPNSTCSELTSTLDILPTFTALAGGKLPAKKIDGHNITGLILAKPDAKSPHKAFFYYHTSQLQAIRSGEWKLVLPQTEKLTGWSGRKKDTPLQLFYLPSDPSEKKNLAKAYPDIVKKLQTFAKEAQKELGDGPKKGTAQRPAGWVEKANPLLLKK